MTQKHQHNQKVMPAHPGEILKEDFMDPLILSAAELAKDLDISANRISQILHSKRSLTVDTSPKVRAVF